MKIIETKVYTYDELSDKAKEKAREWYTDGDDLPFMGEYMREKLVELLKKHNIECSDPKMYYSLSYCQGDGAMFYGTCRWGKFTAYIKHSGHYYHYNSKEIHLEITDTEDDADEKDATAFNELYIQICKELAREGYAYIEGERDDENVSENIRANDYTFTEDGKRFG